MGGIVGALAVAGLALVAFVAGGSVSMLAVAIFAGVLVMRFLGDSWGEARASRRASEGADRVVTLIHLVLTIAGAVVVYRIGSSSYDRREAITRTALVLAMQAAAMVAAVLWLRFVQRSEWIEDPSVGPSGGLASFRNKAYVIAPALVLLALVISIVGVLSTIRSAGGGDAAAACWIAVVMVLWAGALIL